MNLKYFLFCCIVLFVSCKKGWLDVKPSKSLVVPSTIEDYQSLLDNSQDGPSFNYEQPVLGEMCSDDYYIPYSTWQSAATPIEQNNYIWKEDGSYQNGGLGDWGDPYNQILNTNIILEGIEKVNKNDATLPAWNNVKGSALFFRAFNFFNLAQVFCKPFSQSTSTTDLGLPLRLSSNLNEHSTRASVKETYDQIIGDLLIAKDLLPEKPLYITRPSKPGVFALLSRIYLSMEDYDKSKLYADSCLQIYSELRDYKDVNPAIIRPFKPLENPEIIFHSRTAIYGILVTTQLIVDSALYQSYDTSDYRRSLFFLFYGGQIRFRGSYDASNAFAGGLATDEIYLNRAECLARNGGKDAALADLNTLLVNRYKEGSFTPVTASTSDSALIKILEERRKELCFRTLRWIDLRRLNQDPRFAKTLRRILNGQEYTLPPNDPRYVLPIPNNEIRLSGIEQNPR